MTALSIRRSDGQSIPLDGEILDRFAGYMEFFGLDV